MLVVSLVHSISGEALQARETPPKVAKETSTRIWWAGVSTALLLHGRPVLQPPTLFVPTAFRCPDSATASSYDERTFRCDCSVQPRGACETAQDTRDRRG